MRPPNDKFPAPSYWLKFEEGTSTLVPVRVTVVLGTVTLLLASMVRLSVKEPLADAVVPSGPATLKVGLKLNVKVTGLLVRFVRVPDTSELPVTPRVIVLSMPWLVSKAGTDMLPLKGAVNVTMSARPVPPRAQPHRQATTARTAKRFMVLPPG
jgi:hypothetical protein